MTRNSLISLAVKATAFYFLSTSVGQADVLYDNGPFVNSPGTGVGGAHESILQGSLGLNVFGWNVFPDWRIADDFTITDSSGWTIDTITFFGYQIGSPTSPSPLSELNYQIWDDSPGQVGSNIVFGDTTTNRLLSSSWSNTYRVTETTTGSNTDRPIMANPSSAGVFLGPGTYWLDWQIIGSSSLSGPFANPITITGTTATGNGLQFNESTSTWVPVFDAGDPQGFPFIIHGSVVPEPTTTLLLAAGLLGVGIARMKLERYPRQ